MKVIPQQLLLFERDFIKKIKKKQKTYQTDKMATGNGLNVQQEKPITDDGEQRKTYEKRQTIMVEIEGDDRITNGAFEEGEG